MRVLLLVAMAVALALGTTVAAPIPAERKKPPVLYFATQKGTKWVYETGKLEETFVLTDVKEKGEFKIISLGKEEKGKVVPFKVFSVSEKGLYLVASADTNFDPPFCLLKLPAKSGDTWEVVHDQPGLNFLCGTSTVTYPKEIEVPAGKYTTLRLDWKDTSNLLQTRATTWYAPGVGIVKTIKWNANKDSVLKSFTPGKD